LLNHIGDPGTLKAYNDELLIFYKGRKVSRKSEDRLAKGNGLRVLDSQEEEDRVHLPHAPKIESFRVS